MNTLIVGNLKQPEGLKKKFFEIYNDDLIIERIPNKSLRAKLERFRNELGVDFYNLDMTKENAKEQVVIFAERYMGFDTDIPQIGGLGDVIDSLGEICTLLFVQEQATYRFLLDRILDGKELEEDHLKHLNERYWGTVTQKQRKDGTWVLKRSAYFANFGIYRALYDFLIRVSQGNIKMGRCEAADCRRLILQTGGGSRQRYCSAAHRMRAYRRKKKGKTAAG